MLSLANTSNMSLYVLLPFFTASVTFIKSGFHKQIFLHLSRHLFTHVVLSKHQQHVFACFVAFFLSFSYSFQIIGEFSLRLLCGNLWINDLSRFTTLNQIFKLPLLLIVSAFINAFICLCIFHFFAQKDYFPFFLIREHQKNQQCRFSTSYCYFPLLLFNKWWELDQENSLFENPFWQ